MPFVLDASLTTCWLMPDEQSEEVEEIIRLLRNDYAVVPPLWQYEVRNSLIINERRGRLNLKETDERFALLGLLSIRVEAGINHAELVRLSRLHHLTVYDAAYLELAIRNQISLATTDQALIKAARAENISLMLDRSLEH